MAINIFGISDKLRALRDRRPVLGEIVKQSIDQPLHVAMNIASVFVIAALAHYGSVLFQSGSLTLVGSTVSGVVGTAGWNVAREYAQWPSSRWWDPYLDWLFEAGGIALGAWIWIRFLT